MVQDQGVEYDAIVVGSGPGGATVARELSRTGQRVRIGQVLSDDLETEIRDLYVCDASVFPEALDRPTVMTIIAFGKRLGAHSLEGESSG